MKFVITLGFVLLVVGNSAGFFIKEIFRWKLERAKELVDDKIERIKTMAEGIMEEYGKPIEELEQTILKEAERIKNETSFLINSSVKTGKEKFVEIYKDNDGNSDLDICLKDFEDFERSARDYEKSIYSCVEQKIKYDSSMLKKNLVGARDILSRMDKLKEKADSCMDSEIYPTMWEASYCLGEVVVGKACVVFFKNGQVQRNLGSVEAKLQNILKSVRSCDDKKSNIKHSKDLVHSGSQVETCIKQKLNL